MQIGDIIRISTLRPHVEQYNGCTGQIASFPRQDLVYVCVGCCTITLYRDEVEAITPPVEGGAS